MELRTNHNATFDAATDGIQYCDVGAAFLTSRGLQRQSIDYYRRLCRLAKPGESTLHFARKGDLYNAVLFLAAKDGEPATGLGNSRQKDKLDTLVRQGFVAIAQDGGGFVLQFLDPECWVDRSPPPPAFSTTSPDEMQGRLFVAGEAIETARNLGIFSPDEGDFGRPRTGTGSGSQSGTGSASAVQTGTGSGSQPPPHTSYTRARAVDDEVDDDDEVESIEGFCFEETNGSVAGRRTLSQSKLLPSPEKFGSAVDGVARDLRRLRMQRIRIPEPERRDVEAGVPHYENLSLMLRARLTVMAGRLDEAWYLHGIEYVLEFASGSHVKNCFKLLTKDWAKAPDAMRTLSPSRMGLPPDWYDLAAPEILPSGMLPERLQKRRIRQDPESRKSGKEVDWAEIDRLHRKSAKLRAELEEARLAKKRPEGSPNGEEPQRE